VHDPTKTIHFNPAGFARKSCKTCGGSGILRLHAKTNGVVIPKNNQIDYKPCGCAVKKYLKITRGY
jgi:hypothetical protein